MKNTQTVAHSLFQPARLMTLLALLVSALSIGAQAQVCSNNMTFGDPGVPRYVSSGSVPMAFRGFLKANVYGQVKNGKLTDFDMYLDPDVDGPNGVRRVAINYNDSPTAIAPTFSCVPTSTGAKITITRAFTAKQYFHNDLTHSLGYVTVEINFDRVGPGRLHVRYQHRSFNRADSTPPKPYVGDIAFAVPQNGARLAITNR